MKPFELPFFFRHAVSLGTEKVLRQNCILPDFYSKAEAYRRYGRSLVDRWISEGLIKLDNVSPQCINREELEHVACTSNRVTYLPVAER